MGLSSELDGGTVPGADRLDRFTGRPWKPGEAVQRPIALDQGQVRCDDRASFGKDPGDPIRQRLAE